MQGHREKAVTAVFSYIDDLLRAIKIAKQHAWSFRVYSPFPCHEIDELTQTTKSPARQFTLIGAICGLFFGFGLAVWCSMDWPLRVSAKPIVSIPAFVPIGYVCTILFGTCTTFLGILLLCRIPNIFRKSGYDPRFSDNKFGLVIGCSFEDLEEVSKEMKKTGAEEVNVSDAL